MRIRELREEQSLSQEDVAKAIGTNQRNIGRWENEENEPTSGFLLKLADFFEVSIDYLLGRSDDFGVISIKNEKSAPAITQNGQELLTIFNGVEREYQIQILEYARYIGQRRGVNTKHA